MTMDEIEWPTTVTDGRRTLIEWYVNGSNQPRVALREICGYTISEEGDELERRYNQELGRNMAEAFGGYCFLGAFIISPRENLRSTLMNIVKERSEREHGREGTRTLLAIEKYEQMLTEDPSGFSIVNMLVDSFKDSNEPFETGFCAAAIRYKQLYNHFSLILENMSI